MQDICGAMFLIPLIKEAEKLAWSKIYGEGWSAGETLSQDSGINCDIDLNDGITLWPGLLLEAWGKWNARIDMAEWRIGKEKKVNRVDIL